MINPVTQSTYVSFASHHPHTTKKGHFMSITIDNFHNVDDTLMRGAKPDSSQIKELKNAGVKHVISFCTNFNQASNNQDGRPDEEQIVKKLGMEFHWLPFKSTEKPSDDSVQKFFNIIDQAKLNGEKVFMHCRHGADRTGLFAALYRLKYQHVRLSDVVKELMAYGHDANHNPSIIPYIIDFKENLNPINRLRNFAISFFR